MRVILRTYENRALNQRAFWAAYGEARAGEWRITFPPSDDAVNIREGVYAVELGPHAEFLSAHAIAGETGWSRVEASEAGFVQTDGSAETVFAEHWVRGISNFFNLDWLTNTPEYALASTHDGRGRSVTFSRGSAIPEVALRLLMADGVADYIVELNSRDTRIHSAEKWVGGELAHRVVVSDVREPADVE